MTNHNWLIFERDESEIASVYAAGPEDVDLAVKAAKKAFKSPEWRSISTAERGDLMFKLVALIEENKELLATIDTWDNGRYPLLINL